MRTFIKKIALAASLAIASFMAVHIMLSAASVRLTGLAGEVFYVIDKAGRNSGLPAVILGDSVCNQVFPQDKDSPGLAHLGCNQAITSAGNYLLLKKYLEHNPQTKQVFYVITPGALGNDLGLKWTYQYFVVPFCGKENMKLLHDDTTQKLYERFGRLFVENSLIKNFLLNNNLFMGKYLRIVGLRQVHSVRHWLAPTSAIYIPMMEALCKEHNASFTVLPLPVPDTPSNHGWENFVDGVKEHGLEHILGNFVESIRYYPDDWFRDGVHFKPDILKAHLDELRAPVMKHKNSPEP